MLKVVGILGALVIGLLATQPAHAALHPTFEWSVPSTAVCDGHHPLFVSVRVTQDGEPVAGQRLLVHVSDETPGQTQYPAGQTQYATTNRRGRARLMFRPVSNPGQVLPVIFSPVDENGRAHGGGGGKLYVTCVAPSSRRGTNPHSEAEPD
jgi:hypothetical protein